MERLSNEVLLEIFDYLDKSTLERVINVCERWRTVVSLSSKITKRIDIIVNPSVIADLIKQNTNFPYHSMMLNTFSIKSNEISEYEKNIAIFAQQKSKSIKWVEVKYINARFLKKIVEPFENLVHVNLVSNLESPVHDSPAAFEVSLPKLKILGIKGSTNMLKLIKNHHIDTLKIIDVESPQVSRNISAFLKTADKLKQIKFMGFIPQLTDIADYKMKLESFSVLLKGQLPTCPNSIFDFIKHQSSSIKDIKFVGFNTIGLVEFAVSQMNLRKFEIDLTKISGDLERIEDNFSIKRLMLQFTSHQIPNMIKVLSKCLKVEDLKVVSNSAVNFNEWLSKIPHENLRELEVDTILGEKLPKITFKNVKILKCCKISSDLQASCWLELASKCPNVQKLSVSGWNQVVKVTGRETVKDMPKICGSQFCNTINGLKQLEEIYIGGNYQITDEIIFGLVTIDKLNDDSKLRRFQFCSSESSDEEVKERLKILTRTKIQCTMMRETKEMVYHFRNLKRRHPDEN